MEALIGRRTLDRIITVNVTLNPDPEHHSCGTQEALTREEGEEKKMVPWRSQNGDVIIYSGKGTPLGWDKLSLFRPGSGSAADQKHMYIKWSVPQNIDHFKLR